MKDSKNLTGVGFVQTEGTLRTAVTKKHSKKDVGRSFKDNFGRTYVYSLNGLIY